MGISSERVHSDEVFPDQDDVVFYEVALSKEDAYLVTGNTNISLRLQLLLRLLK